MKTLGIVVSSLCLLSLAVLAEGPPTDKFVGGGGPMPSLLFLNLDDLNEAIVDGGYPQLSPILFANGGGGYGGLIDGFRVGGFGLGGDTTSISDSRYVTLDLEYGGLLIENAVQSEADFTILCGALLGFGSLDLHFVEGEPETFEEAVANPFISSISKEFYAAQPYIAVEAKPFSWMWLRFQVGYLWTLPGKWNYGDTAFSGPPQTLGGPTVGIMIRFGGSDPYIDLDHVDAALDEISEEIDALDDSAASDEAEIQPADAAEEPDEAENE